MKVKIDLDIKCPKCSESELIDWQITRNRDRDKLIVDTICHCGFGRQELIINKDI